MTEIDLIGSHGQTIQHLPSPVRLFGKSIRASLQIGSPSAIAKRTGIVTVGDFRVGDIAVGGSGAPLVPIFDYLMLRSKKFNRGVLNIGGIANITILPKRCTIDEVMAFDTGPGNMIIDGLVQQLFDLPFDAKGAVAMKGKIIVPLLRRMGDHPYFKMKPPKSTGRELFGKKVINEILRSTQGVRKEYIITTMTEFTALTIYQQYLKFIRPTTVIDELFISGGGLHNTYLMNALRRYFYGVEISSTDNVHVASDAKEAICFALLANETVAGNPGNIPGATGADRQTVLGTICLP